MPLDSKFYVERQVDQDFQTAIQRRDSIVLIKGPRQVGKTSLLAQGLQQARDAGVIVLLTDFQKLIDAQLQSLETFFIALGEMLADQVNSDVYPEDFKRWRPNRAPNMNFYLYFKSEILGKTNKPVLWGIDEADRLFLCDFSSEVFALFRTWHNERALNPASPCSRLTLSIAYATETYLFIKDQNQSPFNVGTKLFLEDFTRQQLANLNQRYGSPLKNDNKIKQFHQLVGGQPYLVRCGLNDLVNHKLSLNAFISTATRDNGTYGEHLRRIVMLLNRDKPLLHAMQKVLQGQSCPDYDSFYRLRSAGILRGDSKDNVNLRCKIYEYYLKKHLL
ncbi:MAG: AAA-like domain-containing protein [Thiomargarita sp.]|nr:AAA-like domain-containing protein [Thiomargarita sp.]